jgi:hypothetical protein
MRDRMHLSKEENEELGDGRDKEAWRRCGNHAGGVELRGAIRNAAALGRPVPLGGGCPPDACRRPATSPAFAYPRSCLRCALPRPCIGGPPAAWRADVRRRNVRYASATAEAELNERSEILQLPHPQDSL